MPSSRGRLGRLDMPGGEDELLGAQRHRAALALDLHGPLLRLGIPARALGLGRAPVVELHHPRVHLQPVADLVLRREHGPVLGELDVGKVVVPDRVVEAERLVAAAPLVAGPRVTVDDDGRDAELAQPRAQPDAALPAADDDDVGLRGDPELLGLAPAPLEPALAIGLGAVRDTARPGRSAGLLVAFELVERGEQRPGLALLEAQMPAAAADLGLERDPGLGDAVGLRGRLGDVEAVGARLLGRVLDQVGDALPPLHGLEVPREGDEVAPVAVGGEERRGRRRVAVGERLLERAEPALGLLRRAGLRGDGDLGHACSSW